MKAKLVVLCLFLALACVAEWTLGWFAYDHWQLWRAIVNVAWQNVLFALWSVTVFAGLLVAWAFKFFIPASLGTQESKESMKKLEVEKNVEPKELVERLLLCRRIALANLARAKGDGAWIWQGRLAAYNETLAAIQGNREALLQFTVLTEENLELATKLSENLDGKKSQGAET